MASIVLRQFGGMMPSANKKAIPEAAATYVRNINPRFGDFRPLPVASNVATVTAGATLYKFEGSATFLTNSNQVNYVRGPIPTDTTERTYYTGDGAPKVTDLTGTVRALGVPAPSAAPSVTVNTVDEYSREDADKALPEALNYFVNSVLANQEWTYVGLEDAEITQFTTSSAPWNFEFLIAGSEVGGVFVPTNTTLRNLMDARLSFHLDTVSGALYGMVPLTLRGAQLSFGAGLETAISSITNPETGAALLTAGQVADLMESLTDMLKDADENRDAVIPRIRKLKEDFIALASSTEALTEADTAAVAAFYARTEVDTAIDNAKTAAAYEILNAVTTYNTVIS